MVRHADGADLAFRACKGITSRAFLIEFGGGGCTVAIFDEREFFILLPDAALRVRYLKDRGRILRFVVQLEALIDQVWTPVVRYDNAHHFVHRDDLKPDGTQIKTPPMAFANNEDAFNFALQDLRTNYRFYIDRYERWRTE